MISAPVSSKIIKTIALGMLIGKGMSAALWQADRLFPMVPVFGFLDGLPDGVHEYLFYANLLAWSLVFFLKPDRWLLVAAMAVELVMFSLDITRAQPWAWSYLIYLLPFVIDPPCLDDDKRTGSWIVVMLGIYYVWAGIHKFNPVFPVRIFRPVMMKLLHIDQGWLIEEGMWLGYTIPVVELTAGLLLLLPNLRTRWLGWGLMALSHLFIVYMVSPFGAINNHVVLPWNIVLPVMGFFAIKGAGASLPRIEGTPCRVLAACILVFQIGFPIGYYLGLVSDYLAINLYTGRQDLMYAWVPYPSQLPRSLQEHMHVEGKIDRNKVNVMAWSVGELGVPHPQSMRIYRAVARKMCRDLHQPDSRFTFVQYRESMSQVGPIGCDRVEAGNFELED